MERRPIAVRAFRANGEADPGFARNGVAKMDGAAAPAMDLDRGRLLVAASGGGKPPRVIGLKRNGRLDRSFGDEGVVAIRAPHGFSLAEVEADPGGRVVVAGSTGCCGPKRQKRFAVRRFEPDGHVDRTFAGGGFFYLPTPHATPHQAIPVEGLFVSSGNAGGGIAVSGSIGRPPQRAVRFRVEGQASHERCQGRRATIVGSSRAEKLVGTQGADVIVGLGGADRIFGRGGKDVICGGEGRDVVR
jgi:RTX calcium-binding nonapeptide repeat (4 copies)